MRKSIISATVAAAVLLCPLAVGCSKDTPAPQPQGITTNDNPSPREICMEYKDNAGYSPAEAEKECAHHKG